MIASQFLVAGLIAAASATSIVAREDAYFASLLKRQQPGTPAYNCHDNCGSAITLSRGADPCNNAAFVTDYNNCLKCSGPDNYNIWRYYGSTLTTAGASCGFDTQPLAGKQEDVPEAGSTGAASSAAPAQTSSAVQSSAAPASSSVAPASSSVAAPASSQAPTTTEPVTSTPSPSTNASASSTASAPAEVTTNAAVGLRAEAGVFGAIFVGALLGM